MIQDLLGALIAICLVCLAVLDPGILEAHEAILVASGVALAVLGVWAGRADYLKWPGATVVTAGVAIVVVALSGLAAHSSQWMFWVVFWSGNTAGVTSLWSALYRGPKDSIPELS